MDISVFGLGYVGTVCAVCLAHRGHRVFGVDSNPTKVNLINSRRSPIVEEKVGEMLEQVVDSGRLIATQDAEEAVKRSDLSMICVGTPSRRNGSLDTSAVETVAGQIGQALREEAGFHSVVLRSTVLPGTARKKVVSAIEEASGLEPGRGFGFAVNPEFMREGSAVADYMNPPKTVIGTLDETTRQRLSTLYSGLPGKLISTEIEIAEMIKYADNTWHALKVGFANEMGAICKALGIDSHSLMEIFCADTTLNISSAYLKPGFAFGGSCLPKDVRALSDLSAKLDLETPIIRSILPSNTIHVERGLDWILRQEGKRVAFLGFSFKSGTDDLRESPYLELIERLIGKGYEVSVYDPNVQLAKLTGANRDFLLGAIPHVANLMVDSAEAALDNADIVVVSAKAPEYEAAMDAVEDDQVVLDFARLPAPPRNVRSYEGLSW